MANALRSYATQARKTNKGGKNWPAEHAEFHMVLEVIRGKGQPCRGHE